MQSLRFCGALVLFLLAPITSDAATEKACRFADDAPERHLVERGDTLWDLASRFLRDPWCWPDVWANNRDTVLNPHLIYPGQQIRLDRARGMLTRTNTATDTDTQGLPIVRRTPTLRAEAIAITPVPLIASSWLALLRRTPLMSDVEINQAARIVALTADRRMAGTDDIVYVRHPTVAGTQLRSWSAELRRPLAPVLDPDTGKQIALATRRVGRADWLRGTPDGLQAMRITDASEEVMAGDLLVAPPDPEATGRALAPHAAASMQGRVAAILQEGRWAMLHDIVALNRGSRHGLDAGSVVNVVRPVRIASHESPQAFIPASGIDEPVATLLVVEVLEHASLAIVMRAQEPFTLGAAFASPDTANR